MTPDEMLDLCAASLACFNDPARREGYFGLYADSVMIHGYGPTTIHGKPAVRRFYQSLLSAFPDCTVDTQERFAHDDRVVGRFRFRGTHLGEFMGVPPTGRTFDVGGMTILRFAGDRCVERWSVSDFLGLFVQLGVIASPGVPAR